MKYLCEDMNYLRGLCFDMMKLYEKKLNGLLGEYKNKEETDVVALCVDIAEVTKRYEYAESLYYLAKSNSRLLVTQGTLLLLRHSKLFDWSKFTSIEEESSGSYM